MPILIDGNNLMFTLPQGEQTREAVRRLTLDMTRRERISVTLVFDGPQPGPATGGESLGNVEIRYSGARSADDLIIMILKNSRQAKNWKVVTDDHGLQQRAKYLGAAILACTQWKNRRRRPARKSAQHHAKNVPLSSAEQKELEDLFLRNR